MELDLESYFRRINYEGSREPSLSTLCALSLHHATSIPFENIDVVLGHGLRLEPNAVFRKLVNDRRGGYCFEQNGLFHRVLEELGFRITPIGGRVRWQIPRDVTPPRTHVFLLVHLADGEFLADVGLGSATLTNPIPVIYDQELPTPHEPRRLVRHNGRLFHQIRSGTEWADVCEFTLEEMHPIDCEVANWWTSTNPASHFRAAVTAAIALPDGTRKGIRFGEFTHRRGAEILERFAVPTPEKLRAVLAEHFGLTFPVDTRFEPNVEA